MVTPLEDDECTRFFSIVSHAQTVGALKAVVLHIPNEGAYSQHWKPAYGRKLKRMGKISGAADYVVTWNGGSGWIEFKRKGNVQSDYQIAFEAHCVKMNVPYRLVYSCDEGLAVLAEWGLLHLS